MSDTKVYLIYFSPGGTTRKTVRTLSESFAEYEVIEIDMLKKENRNKQYTFRSNDIVILGLMTLVKPFGPVKDIFKAIRGNNTPLIGIVMFGNGMYGNSLKVVNREVKKRGFCMIAGGAFVGAMSYNRTVAANRPDETDTEKIRLFGDAINNKLKTWSCTC
jgi:flavodoxin